MMTSAPVSNNKPNHRRKVIVIPYVRSGDKLLLMVVKDKSHNEWTFISGGCKLYETSEQSAVRELKEETRAAVQLELAKTEYTKFMIETDYREPEEQQQDSGAKVITYYHIYMINITDYKSVPAIVQSFRRRVGCVQGVYDENSDIQFVSLRAFARRANVWPFIKKVVLRHPCFRYHSNRLRQLQTAPAASVEQPQCQMPRVAGERCY
jgi:8-oxo-dGTP pyrophosphatase MutT (NUDIX family)